MSRTVVWFSCGAASACAAKLAVEKHGTGTSVVYCDTSKSEHPDNMRFLGDVELWVGVPITIIKSPDFDTVDEVFMKHRYMAGIDGARCTVEMKKIPRFAYQRPDDTHIFGLRADEPDRIAKFVGNNPELALSWVLVDSHMDEKACYRMVEDAGIELPAMYRLGYRNNNCIGCVKATSIEYWEKIRDDFPEIFARRAAQSRELGVRLTRLHGERIFLDEIPAGTAPLFSNESVSCGPECSNPN